MKRRHFLSKVTGAALAAGASVSLGQPATPARLRPAAASAWTKHGVVLDAADGWTQNFTNVAEPLDADRWRLWYSQRSNGKRGIIGVAEGRPGEPMTRTPAVLSPGDPVEGPLSIGNLPADWRPTQPVYLRLRNGRHRLYFWAHGPKVVRYLVAESDDGRRYRVRDPGRPCLYHPSDRAVDGPVAAAVGLSRLAKRQAAPVDGEPLARAVQVCNDATNVYQLPDGSFEMYSVALVEVAKGHPGYIAHDNCPGWLRVIDRFRSDDGLFFADRQRVIAADGADPPDMQFYYLAVNYTPQGRVGLLGHYRVEAQTMDLEWCFSADGVRWQRPDRRGWIARGEPGQPDCYGIYANHGLVQHQGRWHLFYTGVNGAHNHKHVYGVEAQVVMHASCPAPWTTEPAVSG